MARRAALNRPLVELEQMLAPEPPTWQQVADFFRHGEFYDEQYLVAAIKRHLLTDKQAAWMSHFGIDIPQMLNGRVAGVMEQAVEETIYHDWNKKLGHYQFGGEGHRMGQLYPNYDAERRENKDHLWELVIPPLFADVTVRDDETGSVYTYGQGREPLSSRVPSKWFILADTRLDLWVRLADLEPNAMNHARQRQEMRNQPR
jgi:hypothetical protein